MKYVRTNVYANGGDFSDPILLWYARGVAAMQARPLADPTSWRFFAAIHGIDEERWRTYGYLADTDVMPSQHLIRLYWNQCQHGTWYFLPWHRGYVLAWEAMVREAIISLGGPEDWAVPYWNYFAPGENSLPPAFASLDWPDGTGNNPLFIEQRWGPKNDGRVFVPPSLVDLDALAEPHFAGTRIGGAHGFGGMRTGFRHRGRKHSHLEQQPHDMVHVLVGGRNPADKNLTGLMTYVPTAALDPIFWLHHANIDRLWEVWLLEGGSRKNPAKPRWVDGPASTGDHGFVMPLPPDGEKWTFTPGDVGDLSRLDYGYDDLSRRLSPGVEQRLERLRAATAPMEGVDAMEGESQEVELVGASNQPLRIVGSDPVRASVRLDERASRRMRSGLAAGGRDGASERVFLNLENVRSFSDATVLEVYVNLPEGADPADHPELRAGAVGLFGVSGATLSDGEHAGEGLTPVLEITHILSALRPENALDPDSLEVRIIPFAEVPDETPVDIGGVSLFRQGPQDEG